MNLYEDTVSSFLERCYGSGIKDPLRLMIDMMPRIYGYLMDAFPRKILPTDVDGEVEINGHFLRLEFKHESALRNGNIPEGQFRCFRSLLKTKCFTIFFVGHDQTGRITMLWMWDERGKKKVLDPCSQQRFYDACKNWADKYK